MLIRFVCSTLWRFHHSIRPEIKDVDVGDWEPNLRAVTFGGSEYQAPDVFTCAIHQSVYPTLPNRAYGMTPKPVETWDRCAIQFSIHGLLFLTKLVHEDWPAKIQNAVLNQTQNSISSYVWYWDASHFAGLRDAVKMMQMPRKPDQSGDD